MWTTSITGLPLQTPALVWALGCMLGWFVFGGEARAFEARGQGKPLGGCAVGFYTRRSQSMTHTPRSWCRRDAEPEFQHEVQAR
ncbi:hypothetical protein BD779DRAFT_1578458 [Infundibulicybe gibba]|nr:hypothetical protein BD779DRAFT_1578458 [Infundibulicybe gibba]